MFSAYKNIFTHCPSQFLLFQKLSRAAQHVFCPFENFHALPKAFSVSKKNPLPKSTYFCQSESFRFKKLLLVSKRNDSEGCLSVFLTNGIIPKGEFASFLAAEKFHSVNFCFFGNRNSSTRRICLISAIGIIPRAGKTLFLPAEFSVRPKNTKSGVFTLRFSFIPYSYFHSLAFSCVEIILL